MTKIIAIITILFNHYHFENSPSSLMDSLTWASTEYQCVNEGDEVACQFICEKSLEWLTASDVIASIPECEKPLFIMGKLD